MRIPFDNPRYLGISFAEDAPSFVGNESVYDDFLPERFPEISGTTMIASLANVWRPSVAICEVRPFIDFTMIGDSIPVFSQRAFNALKDFLLPNGECLPTPLPYLVFNCRTLVDVLEREHSELYYSSPKNQFPCRIDKYVPKEDSLNELSIFRIVHAPWKIFVTEKFREACIRSGLFGPMFVKLWPLPDSRSWREEELEELDKAMLVSTPSGPRRVNTSMLMLNIVGMEEAEAMSLSDELDGQLFQIDKSVDGPFLGNVSDITFHSKDLKIEFTTPQPAALSEWLENTLCNNWPDLNFTLEDVESADMDGEVAITDQILKADILDLIHGSAIDAQSIFSVGDNATPPEIVKMIDDVVHNIQRGLAPELPPDEDAGYLLGSLWGQQLVRAFDWEWAAISIDQTQPTTVGIVSRDRSLVIYPFDFVTQCILQKCPVTIALAFDMLSVNDEIPEFPPGSYENLMEGVHHVVPRD